MSSRLQRCDLQNFPHMKAELQRRGKELNSARYNFRVSCQNLRRVSLALHPLSLLQTICVFQFGASIVVEDVASKVVSLFHLHCCKWDSDTAKLHWLQLHIQIRGNTWPEWRVLEPTAGTKVFQPQKLCLAALFGSTNLCDPQWLMTTLWPTYEIYIFFHFSNLTTLY